MLSLSNDRQTGEVDMSENKSYIINADEKGSINIAEDVVTIIVAVAAAEVEGVHGPFISYNKENASVVGKRGLSKGIRLAINGDDVIVDVNIIVEIGYSVSEVGAGVQKAVMTALQDAAGLAVKAVNVNICGISLKKK